MLLAQRQSMKIVFVILIEIILIMGFQVYSHAEAEPPNRVERATGWKYIRNQSEPDYSVFTDKKGSETVVTDILRLLVEIKSKGLPRITLSGGVYFPDYELRSSEKLMEISSWELKKNSRSRLGITNYNRGEGTFTFKFFVGRGYQGFFTTDTPSAILEATLREPGFIHDVEGIVELLDFDIKLSLKKSNSGKLTAGLYSVEDDITSEIPLDELLKELGKGYLPRPSTKGLNWRKWKQPSRDCLPVWARLTAS